jgi:hypothetical protein
MLLAVTPPIEENRPAAINWLLKTVSAFTYTPGVLEPGSPRQRVPSNASSPLVGIPMGANPNPPATSQLPKGPAPSGSNGSNVSIDP